MRGLNGASSWSASRVRLANSAKKSCSGDLPPPLIPVPSGAVVPSPLPLMCRNYVRLLHGSTRNPASFRRCSGYRVLLTSRTVPGSIPGGINCYTLSEASLSLLDSYSINFLLMVYCAGYEHFWSSTTIYTYPTCQMEKDILLKI